MTEVKVVDPTPVLPGLGTKPGPTQSRACRENRGGEGPVSDCRSTNKEGCLSPMGCLQPHETRPALMVGVKQGREQFPQWTGRP